ncbi:MAG TPA: Pycsar system effector family protein [Chitinophagaceae bacterium]|nr:Pycsar system effector family protein [Chitinophagaceae bacterium]
MNHLPIVSQAKDYVTKYLQEHQNKKVIYHTIQHTEAVVEIAKQISTHYELNNNDTLVTLVAAWFIDTGYYDDYRQHEVASARMAEVFLKKAGVGEDVVKEVRGCLLATKMPQSPANLPQQIVCDAALFHLAAADFGQQNKLIRKELCLLQGEPIDKNVWRKTTLQFLEGHTYFTDYCKKHLAKRKKENIEKLQKKEAEAVRPVDPVTALLQSKPAPVNVAADKGEKKKDERPERTIETMFRITSDKSQRLSDQADTKSNILISVNALILTGVISLLVPKLDNNDHDNFKIPVLILLLVSLLTIIFSILATRPRIPHGTFTPNELKDKSVNLLFFGNFYKMDFEHYNNGMFQVMDDRHFLYLTLLRDIYTQGIRLGEKYRMLTLAYNVFMYGLILSIIAFVIAGII